MTRDQLIAELMRQVEEVLDCVGAHPGGPDAAISLELQRRFLHASDPVLREIYSTNAVGKAVRRALLSLNGIPPELLAGSRSAANGDGRRPPQPRWDRTCPDCGHEHEGRDECKKYLGEGKFCLCESKVTA